MWRAVALSRVHLRLHQIMFTLGFIDEDQLRIYKRVLGAYLPYFLLEFSTLENGTNWFYNNVGTKLPLCTA
jgi:hypothetical protein